MSDTIIAFISGSTVAIIASYLAHILSESREKRYIFNTAAAQFRLAFWPEIELFDKHFLVDRASIYATKRSCDILYEAVSRHQKAVFEFRQHLGCINRHRLDKAWKQYCKEGNNRHYFSEEYPCDDRLIQSFSEEKALTRINTILKFAKPK